MPRLLCLTAATALLLLVTPACAPSSLTSASSGPAFYTPDSEYRSSEGISLLLVNQTDAALRYNLCRSTLQRWNGSQWQDVSAEDANCPSIRFRLLPSETTLQTFQPRQALSSGRYRFVASVTLSDDPSKAPAARTYTTPAFRITSSAVSIAKSTSGLSSQR